MKFYQHKNQAVSLTGIRSMEVRSSGRDYHIYIYYSSTNRSDNEILGSFKNEAEAQQVLADIVNAINGTVKGEENSENPLTDA